MHNYTWICSQSLPIQMWEVSKWFEPSVTYKVHPIKVFEVNGPLIRFEDEQGTVCNGYPGEFFKTKEEAEAEAFRLILEDQQ